MILDDIREYLIAGGVAWRIYESFLPDEADEAVVITEYPGEPAETMQRETEVIGLQLRVRGQRLDYATVRAVWERAFNLLQDASQGSGSPLSLSGVVFIQARAYGPLVFHDEKGRPNCTSNFRVKRYR